MIDSAEPPIADDDATGAEHACAANAVGAGADAEAAGAVDPQRQQAIDRVSAARKGVNGAQADADLLSDGVQRVGGLDKGVGAACGDRPVDAQEQKCDSRAGVIVRAGDIDALAASLADLHQNRQKLIELASNGLALARTKSLDAN